jgi:hypothetical protein
MKEIPSQVMSSGLNLILDMFLTVVRYIIVVMEREQINIPDNAEEKDSWVCLRNGRFSNLSSIVRTRDVKVDCNKNGDYIVEVGFGFKDFEICYENYEARIMGLPVAGRLAVKSGSNSISITFRLSTCSDDSPVHLESVRFDTLGAVSVHVTGFGPFNWFFSWLIKWLVVPSKWRGFGTDIEKKLKKINENMQTNL